LNFELDGKLIDSATMRQPTFTNYSDYISEALAMTQPADIDTRLRRIRLSRQFIFNANGVVVPVSTDQVTRMPIPDARKLLARLGNLAGGLPPGRIVKPGDGINTSIVVELGTPIVYAQGKEPVRELEFLAQNYGEIEDVLSEYVPAIQTTRLIKLVAKPLGTTLLRLTDAMCAAITIADGMMITQDVLPFFTQSPDE
jgi:hypothetical protein